MNTTIFNQSKYTRWYYAIVHYRQVNPLNSDIYSETHHIIPDSFYINRKRDGPPGWLEGDPDEKDNLVNLTGREHALCHWLLKKMTAGRARELMIYSFNMMNVYSDHQNRGVSRMITQAYERNRIEWSKLHSEKMKGKEPWNKGLDMKDDPRCKGGRKNKGKKHSEETKKLIGASQLGKKMSLESSERKRQAMTGFKRGPMTDEEKLKRKLANMGKKKSGEHSSNVAKANIGKISINKDGVEKKINKDSLDQFLSDGWQLGGRKRIT